MSDIKNIEDAIKLKKIKQKYIQEKESIEFEILMLERKLEVIDKQLKECNTFTDSNWHDKAPMSSADIKKLYEDYMKNEYHKKEDE